jgi:hypothetical protein
MSRDDMWAIATELATLAGELRILMFNDILGFSIDDMRPPIDGPHATGHKQQEA